MHISQISDERVERVSDKLKEGDLVRVKVLEVDRQGRVRLSMRNVDAAGKGGVISGSRRGWPIGATAVCRRQPAAGHSITDLSVRVILLFPAPRPPDIALKMSFCTERQRSCSSA